MGRNVIKASLELRSLVRHGRTDTHFETPTFLSQTVTPKTDEPMIDTNLGKAFPPAAVVIGYIFVATGLFIAFGNPVLGIGLAAVGAFGAFARTGVQIQPEKKTYREYTSLFGVAVGSWKPLEGFADVAVLKKTLKTTAYSRANRPATTGSNDFFDVCMLDPTHRKKQVVHRFTDKDLAVKEGQSLAQILNLRDGPYDPQLSATSKAKRR